MSDSPRRDVSRSWELYDRACEIIPMGTQTHSKAPREALRGSEPCFIERGDGCRLWDLDGNEYLDLRCALGPMTLGYRYPAVEQAVREQLEKGTVFSYPTSLEVEVAERLVELIPCAESVRFLRTGGEAMSAAMKLARAYTGRDRVLMCGYHGWLSTMATTGVPEAVKSVHTPMAWGDLQAYEDILTADGDHVAALSVAYSYSVGDNAGEFLGALRELADRFGCVLIFDEIVTGFRLANGGSQERFGVTPDLAVFAKGMANGWPVSTYLGRREIMETVRTAIISSTYGGEATGLAAARACLDVYRSEDVIGHLEARGKELVDGLNTAFQAVGAPAEVLGLPMCPTMTWRDSPTTKGGDLAVRFSGEWLQRGVISYSVMYVNYSHTAEDLQLILQRAADALTAMQEDGCFG